MVGLGLIEFLDSFDKALEHGTSYRSLERVANGDQSAFKNYPPE